MAVQGPSARSVAAFALERVERDGAYAAAALDTEIERHPQLDARDRALATELVYGVLRTRGALAARLQALASRGLPTDTRIRLPLLVAAYQLLLLDRVPPHAAVDEAVKQIRAARGPKPAGFANALLRRLSSEGKLDRASAILDSAPRWLFESIERAVGTGEARALFGVDPTSDAVALRAIAGRPLPAWLEQAPRGRVSPRARLVPRGGDLSRREGYAEGTFVRQEEGAQAVALALGARPGERVLDACAGRGQKTSLLREQLGDGAHLVAVDLHDSKLRALLAEFGRLKLVPPEVRAVDWTRGTGGTEGGFDRVLVDAPCTGTGTLRHRPEIAGRLSPGDPARMGTLAESILRSAASLARPGGRVVFAVCSVLTEETDAVVERVRDILEPSPFDAPELAPLLSESQTTLRLLPVLYGTDGFFIASMVKPREAPTGIADGCPE